LVGVVYVIFSFVGNAMAGALAASVVLIALVSVWLAIPLFLGHRDLGR
jgi:hypothetical protein